MKDLTLPCILVSQGPSKSGASSNRRASSNDLQVVIFCLFVQFIWFGENNGHWQTPLNDNSQPQAIVSRLFIQIS